MSNMSLESALNTTTDVNDITTGLKPVHSNEEVKGGDSDSLKKAVKENSEAESNPKRTYDAISENGDILEISEAGSKFHMKSLAHENLGGDGHAKRAPPSI